MKYRIKYIPKVGYFSQVYDSVENVDVFFYVITRQIIKTIGRHPYGEFGLYTEDHTSYPMKTRGDAEERIELYDEWIERQNNDPEYTNYKPARVLSA